MKIIENIAPFNHFFYRDCLYNSLFSVIGYFGEDIWHVLSNELMLYKKTPDSIFGSGIVYTAVKPLTQILEDMGIQASVENCGDMISYTCRAIDRGMPVIIKVDCYDESIRRDLYKKEHLDHNILIYGYDETEGIFYIIEHSSRNSLNYKYQKISFADAKKAHMGYIDYFSKHKPEDPLIIKYFRKEKSSRAFDENTPAHQFLTNCYDNRAEIAGQKKYIDIILSRLEFLLMHQCELEKNIDDVVFALTEIINSTTVSKRKLERFLADPEITAFADTLLTLWQYIRLTVLNFKFGGVRIGEKLNAAVAQLRMISETETGLIDSVLLICRKKLS